ncbi:PilW family protein [Variovorax robiniae]|uniref:PilW family protein n=1 Tax=Variovorax robiniae TaxID=1836199 RepID=A0ABU8XF79_9BURK
MRPHSPSRPRRPQRQRGVTLVELMVALTIGLILVIIASAIYLYSKQSYNAVSENSQMEENGRFAINLLTKSIQSAGFAMVDPTAPGPTLPLGDKLAGCEFGYVNANSTAALTMADLACRTATPTGQRPSAAIFTRYETDTPAATGGKQQGYDCTNAAAASKQLAGGVQTYEVRSYFFVSQVNVQTPSGTKSMGQLGCASDATPVVNGVPVGLVLRSQPMVPGIEQLAFNYISTAGKVVPIPTSAPDWQDIAAVDVCVLARTIQASGNDTATGYTDCYGTAITAGPSESYRTYRATVALRNTAAP